MPTHDSKMKFRAVMLADGKTVKHKLYIYDEVRASPKFNWNTWEYEDSETSAKYFRDLLDAIPDGEPIELHVNSAGGEVTEGTSIYNLLRQKSNAGSKIVGYVDGAAYSIAMDIILAADEIHMGLGTSMFLHNPWCLCAGNADQLRKQADQLDALAAASRQLYAERSNLSEEEIGALMDAETMLAPNDCLKYGFCDFVGELPEEDDEDDFKEPDDDNDVDDKTDDTDDVDDDEDKKKKQLKEALFRQSQIDQFCKTVAKNRMSRTFTAAVAMLTSK